MNEKKGGRAKGENGTKYKPEFAAIAGNLSRWHALTRAQIAAVLGVRVRTFRAWVRRYKDLRDQLEPGTGEVPVLEVTRYVCPQCGGADYEKKPPSRICKTCKTRWRPPDPGAES